MTAHLNLPYQWENCIDPENCRKYNHATENAETLNNYPIKWVEELIGCQIDEYSIRFFDEEHKLHRVDGPALQEEDGYQQWYLHGVLHREDGPAEEYGDGSAEWWVNGELHRLNGPAVKYLGGVTEWWIHGKQHREDGPAVIKPGGNEEWWLNGELQKTGPPQWNINEKH